MLIFDIKEKCFAFIRMKRKKITVKKTKLKYLPVSTWTSASVIDYER